MIASDRGLLTTVLGSSAAAGLGSGLDSAISHLREIPHLRAAFIKEQREKKEFESFEDMKKRIQNLPDPEKAIERRIFQELTIFERHNLFTK